MKTQVFVLFLSLLFQSAVSQQCDVVVTSHASLKKELQALLGSSNTTLNGNTTCSNVCTAMIGELETRLDEKMDTKLEAMLERIEQTIQDTVSSRPDTHRLGTTPRQSASSCAEILHNYPNTPSGHYWISILPNYPARRYCNMTLSCGGVTGGWMKVAELDMTNSSQQCPSGLRQRTDAHKRTCAKSHSAGCSSVTFPVETVFGYSKVCGKIKAFQYGSPDSFGRIDRTYRPDINGIYVDGVSLTVGNPRHHVWTFAAALDEVGTHPIYNCPCINTNQEARATRSPVFVGNDYFCDTASVERYQIRFFHDDPLWDGAGCGPHNTCCTFNTPPWFYKQLPHPTSDSIEMRVCTDQSSNNEDIAIEKIDIYVH